MTDLPARPNPCVADGGVLERRESRPGKAMQAIKFTTCLLTVFALGGCSQSADVGTNHPDAGASASNSQGGTSDPSYKEEKEGTVEAGPKCSGTPSPCDEVLDKTYCQAGSCTWTAPQCTGTAHDCNGFSSAVCPHVPGCSWQVLFGGYRCVGRAVACDERALTGNCDAVMGKSGCTMTGGCSGTPAACETHSARDCDASLIPGCTLK